MERRHAITDAPERRHSVRSVYLAAFAQGAVAVMLPASSVLLRDRLGLGDTAYGALFLPWFGLAFLTATFSHILMRRFSLRGLYLAALTSQSAAMVLLALSLFAGESLGRGALVAGMALNGVGAGIHGITLNTAVIELFPAARSGALAVMHGSLGAGASLWPLFVAFCIRTGAWPVAPLTTGIGVAFLAWTSSRRDLVGLCRTVEPGHARTDVPGRLWGWSVTSFLYGVAEATFTAWAVVFLTEGRGIPLEGAAAALSAFWVAMTGGRFVGAVLVRRVGARRMGLVLCFAVSASFLLISGSRGPVDAVLRFAIAGLSCSSLFPLLLALASADLPQRTPRVSAVFSAAILMGLTVGSFGIGPIRAAWGLPRIYAVSSLGPLLLAALLLGLTRAAPPGDPKASASRSRGRDSVVAQG